MENIDKHCFENSIYLHNILNSVHFYVNFICYCDSQIKRASIHFQNCMELLFAKHWTIKFCDLISNPLINGFIVLFFILIPYFIYPNTLSAFAISSNVQSTFVGCNSEWHYFHEMHFKAEITKMPSLIWYSCSWYDSAIYIWSRLIN